MNYLIHPSVLFNKESVMELGGYDEAFRTGQDGNLWLRMINYGFKIDIINEPLIKYRISDSNVTISRLKYQNIHYRFAQICADNGKYRLALKNVIASRNFRLILLIILRFMKVNIVMRNLSLSRNDKWKHKFKEEHSESKIQEMG
jgi:hypothetical protein